MSGLQLIGATSSHCSRYFKATMNWFFKTTALMLLMTSAAKLYSATGSAKILSVPDVFLHINNRWLMVSLAVIEALASAYLLIARNNINRAMLVIWLSSNFIFYRIVNYVLHITYCPCLGTLGQKLPLSQGRINIALTAFVLYWFVGAFYAAQASSAGRLSSAEDACSNQNFYDGEEPQT